MTKIVQTTCGQIAIYDFVYSKWNRRMTKWQTTQHEQQDIKKSLEWDLQHLISSSEVIRFIVC